MRGSIAQLAIIAVLTVLTMPLHAGIYPLAFGGRGESPTLAPMLEQTIPAVVSISATAGRNPAQPPDGQKSMGQQGKGGQPLDGFSFHSPRPGDPLSNNRSGLGSGVIIDRHQGYIITNHHLIDGAKEIDVILDDGRTFPATTVGTDMETDIALLKIRASNLQAIPLGDSSQLRVGDFVIAIGNPFGLGNTATSGIVSALGRSNLGLERFEEFIQTDASINVGNSGGALVNLEGRLVGINTAILAPNGGSVGIGFAIPINMVREITAQLIQDGSVQRGYLGVTSKKLSPNLARSLRLDPEEGVLITRVEPNSPAEEARIQKGDILIAINDHRINNPNQLQNVIGLFSVGKKLKLTVLRGGHTRQLYATILKPVSKRLMGEDLHNNMSGVVLVPMPAAKRAYYPSGGVSVHSVDPERAGWTLGLRPDDVIFSFNRQPVNGLRDAEKAASLSGKMVILRVYRGEKIIEMIMR